MNGTVRSTARQSTRAITAIGAAALALALRAPPAWAEVRLPHLFGDHMVIQCDRPVPIWGWADPDEPVTVAIGTETHGARADAEGRWRVVLEPRPSGGPFEIRVSGRNTITLRDVLAGEVWLCSGQSNMEMGVTLVRDGANEARSATDPQIRLFMVPNRPSGLPREDVDASWKVCSPQSIAEAGWGGFSALAYFFARELRQELKVPVGVIDATWGGTRAEPWTPPIGFERVPSLDPIRREIVRADDEYRRAILDSLPALEAWILRTRSAASGGAPTTPPPELPRHGLESERRPTGLYNGMIHALVPFPIRGVIWYQGESNLGDGEKYLDRMKALIEGWRSAWNAPAMPFLFVQIAPFRYRGSAPEALPEIWESQRRALEIPDTGMAVTTDIADLDDIHPKEKQAIARRLALWALARTYGRQGIVFSGPLFRSMSVDGGAMRIEFDHAAGGLATRDGAPVDWFEIAGADGRFVKAEAAIDGERVIVRSAEIPDPVAVRFGWSMEATPNLVNRDGLPASPFRARR